MASSFFRKSPRKCRSSLHTTPTHEHAGFSQCLPRRATLTNDALAVTLCPASTPGSHFSRGDGRCRPEQEAAPHAHTGGRGRCPQRIHKCVRAHSNRRPFCSGAAATGIQCLSYIVRMQSLPLITYRWSSCVRIHPLTDPSPHPYPSVQGATPARVAARERTST
jgi:hypothetical protein